MARAGCAIDDRTGRAGRARDGANSAPARRSGHPCSRSRAPPRPSARTQRTTRSERRSPEASRTRPRASRKSRRRPGNERGRHHAHAQAGHGATARQTGRPAHGAPGACWCRLDRCSRSARRRQRAALKARSAALHRRRLGAVSPPRTRSNRPKVPSATAPDRGDSPQAASHAAIGLDRNAGVPGS